MINKETNRKKSCNVLGCKNMDISLRTNSNTLKDRGN